jgi:hypothetical protein
MANDYRWWKCKDCGNEVMAIFYPKSLTKWSDGHICRYVDATDELKKEMPEYAESMKNITKGE